LIPDTGYSFLTNQYGLAIDNVVEFELVLPTGVVVHVSEKAHPDLFFGLRGGFNNLGVVTRFTVKTYPSSQIWVR
jgi:FAD/FMN-containing dehydrogenase